jgi:hypothetical protein
MSFKIGGSGGGSVSRSDSADSSDKSEKSEKKDRSEKKDKPKAEDSVNESRAQESRAAEEARSAEAKRQAERQRKAKAYQQDGFEAGKPATATFRAQSAAQPEATGGGQRAELAGPKGWDGRVEDWQKHSNQYRDLAQSSLTDKRLQPRFDDPKVKQAIKAGGSDVHVGHWSNAPGQQNVPVFFQDFKNTNHPVQLYSYPQLRKPVPEDPAQLDAAIRNATWVSFDVSGNIARAYGDESYMAGNTGTASKLGLPESGAEGLNPAREWPDGWLAKDPEIAEAMKNGQVKFQVFEGGILVELPNGKVQAFGKDPVERLGGSWPGGKIDGVASTPSTGPGGGMVGIANGHFMLNGDPFKHVGANVAQLLYEHPDRIWTELNKLKDAGVKDVRVFLPNSAMSPKEVGDNLEVLLDQAKALGMKATVSLTHFARQEFYTETRPEFLPGSSRGGFQVVQGDEGYADEPVYQRNPDGSVKMGPDGKPALAIGHPVLGDDWLQGGYKQNFKPFAEYIVDRFKNHEGVFAWEVANETKSYSTPADTNAVKGFYSDMVAAIRAKDPNHLISAGLTNTREFVGTNERERKAFLAQFDFVSIHQYNADLQGDIDTDIRLAKELGKPIIMGEFGFFPTDTKGRPSMEEVERYIQDLYKKGVDAVMPWGAGVDGGERWWDDDYGPNGQSQFHDILRRANTSAEQWNAAH